MIVNPVRYGSGAKTVEVTFTGSTMYNEVKWVDPDGKYQSEQMYSGTITTVAGSLIIFTYRLNSLQNAKLIEGLSSGVYVAQAIG